jgi:hypothetical protein
MNNEIGKEMKSKKNNSSLVPLTSLTCFNLGPFNLLGPFYLLRATSFGGRSVTFAAITPYVGICMPPIRWMLSSVLIIPAEPNRVYGL